jgi:hypothetical protein
VSNLVGSGCSVFVDELRGLCCFLFSSFLFLLFLFFSLFIHCSILLCSPFLLLLVIVCSSENETGQDRTQHPWTPKYPHTCSQIGFVSGCMPPHIRWGLALRG